MLLQVWQAAVDWVARNAQLYWTGIGVAVVVWLVWGLALSTRRQREQGAKMAFGDTPRFKLQVGLPFLLILAALLLGTSPLLLGGGFAAIGGFVLFLVVAAMATVVFLITLYWMSRRRLITFDVPNRSWRIERGFAFALRVERGSFEDIRHIVLQEVATWSKTIWRIAVVWKDNKAPYVLHEAWYNRPGIMGGTLLFLQGLSAFAAGAYRKGWELQVKRLEKYAARLALPGVIEKELP